MPQRHFIILGEPFSGLDPVSLRSVLKMIERVAHEHTLNTFVIVTHDVTSALVASDRVCLLGRERDEAGEVTSGARIVKEYDLIKEGLAYRPDAEDLPGYNPRLTPAEGWSGSIPGFLISFTHNGFPGLTT